MKSPEMLTVDEVAAICHVSPMTVRRLIARGDMTGYRIGRSIRVRTDDVTAFMRAAVVVPEVEG